MPAHSQQRRRSHQVDFSQQCGMPYGLTPGEIASSQQGSHVKRKKRLSDVPVASLHAAHPPWGLRPAARFPGQQPQEQILIDDSNTSMANSALPNAAALVDSQPLRSHQQHTSGFHQGHNPHEAAMRALKSMIWRLDPQTRMAFKDSLYRISRCANCAQHSYRDEPPASLLLTDVQGSKFCMHGLQEHQCESHRCGLFNPHILCGPCGGQPHVQQDCSEQALMRHALAIADTKGLNSRLIKRIFLLMCRGEEPSSEHNSEGEATCCNI